VRSRALLLTLVIPACCAGITACGGARAAHRDPRVQLQLRSPADGTSVAGSSVTVSGTVSPARAEVRVVGRPARVQPDGTFSMRVALRTGMNLIDVLASLPHASEAMSAIRVERYVLITVPQVVGESPSDAETALRNEGLVPKVQPSGNPFTFVVPLPEQVCSSTPPPGARVSPGSTVVLATGKFC
jgi:hypothetical protein